MLHRSLAALALAAVLAGPAAAETSIPVGRFRSVALQGGGLVILKPAATPRVTIRTGTPEYTRVSLRDDRLVIERCPEGCPDRYESVVEVFTPELEAVMVKDGGTIRADGAFGGQAALRAGVGDGGTLDLRAMNPGDVTAMVMSGGRIFTRAARTLNARIEQGGIVKYWGNPHVSSSVHQGGVVEHGRDGDLRLPLEKIGPGLPQLPTPPTPPAAPKSRKVRI